MKPKQLQPDMHPADILAALKKKGLSMAQLSRNNGLASGTLSNTLRIHWPKGERIIAEALGREVTEIWPSRYKDYG